MEEAPEIGKNTGREEEEFRVNGRGMERAGGSGGERRLVGYSFPITLFLHSVPGPAGCQSGSSTPSGGSYILRWIPTLLVNQIATTLETRILPGLTGFMLQMSCVPLPDRGRWMKSRSFFTGLNLSTTSCKPDATIGNPEVQSSFPAPLLRPARGEPSSSSRNKGVGDGSRPRGGYKEVKYAIQEY